VHTLNIRSTIINGKCYLGFLWLAIRDSLSTYDKILKWGVNGDVKCFFCCSIIECREHFSLSVVARGFGG
jgi:hypothetical protein